MTNSHADSHADPHAGPRADKAAQRATTLWDNGASGPATMLWITDSHAEIVVSEGKVLDTDALVAVVLREFLSMPMRVIAQTGQNVVLQLVEKPHKSVLDLIDRDLIEAGVAQLRDALEERAVPNNRRADTDAWHAQAVCEDLSAVTSFRRRVRELEAHREFAPRETIAA